MGGKDIVNVLACATRVSLKVVYLLYGESQTWNYCLSKYVVKRVVWRWRDVESGPGNDLTLATSCQIAMRGAIALACATRYSPQNRHMDQRSLSTNMAVPQALGIYDLANGNSSSGRRPRHRRSFLVTKNRGCSW